MLKMRQEEKDRQGSQLVQDLLNDRIGEIKKKNDEKFQKRIRAQELFEEKMCQTLDSFGKKMETVNVRLDLKEKEFNKLLQNQRKKDQEHLKKHDARIDRLDQNME